MRRRRYCEEFDALQTLNGSSIALYSQNATAAVCGWISMFSRMLSFLAVSGLILASACSGGGALPGSGVTTQSASSNTPSLKCFTINGGTCIISAGTVTLDNTAQGSAAGVYFASSNNLKGLLLSQIKTLSFTLDGTGYQPAQGSPRVSIPVNYNGSGTTAYVYVQDCNWEAVPYPYTVDALSDHYCKEMQGYSTPQYQPSWTQFTTDFSTATISGTPSFLADSGSPGLWKLTNIQISK